MLWVAPHHCFCATGQEFKVSLKRSPLAENEMKVQKIGRWETLLPKIVPERHGWCSPGALQKACSCSSWSKRALNGFFLESLFLRASKHSLDCERIGTGFLSSNCKWRVCFVSWLVMVLLREIKKAFLSEVNNNSIYVKTYEYNIEF